MAKSEAKLSRLLALTRPGMLVSLVSALWTMTLLAFYLEPANRRNPALQELGLRWSLPVAAVIAAGLGLFMIVLNDALDARHDRAFEPDRPIPSGKVTQRAALGLAMFGLLLALGASVALGPLSMFIALATAAAIVFYNVAGRFVPAVGIVTLGLAMAVASLIPNPNLAFAWPVLLVMTYTIAAATLRHVLAAKRPALTPINGWGILIGWAFWSLVVLMLIRVRGENIERSHLTLVWLGPTIAVVILVLLTWLILGPASLHPRSRRATAKRFTRLATAWLIAVNASWLIAAGLWWQGLLVLALMACLFVSITSQPAAKPG